MSSAYIEEFAGIQTTVTSGDVMQFAQQPSVATQKVAFTATHGESAAFNKATNLVRIHTDGIASYLFSAAGTAATTSNPRLAASTTEYFAVRPGDIVSFITNT